MYSTLGIYLDGQWIHASSRETMPVLNPATGEVLAALPIATPADLDLAVEAADSAFARWRAVSAYDRAAMLRKTAELIRERHEAIARILTLEQGKVLSDARAEVLAAADIIEWSGEEARRIYGRVIPSRQQGLTQLMVPEPVGPAAAFTPWNFPASTPARKIGTALAAGCSVILKASEETPGTAVEIVRAFEDAGVPSGVIGLVFGDPAQISERILKDERIRKISFTGSIPVGKQLTRMAADTLKRVTMELGGHGAALVFPDVDPVDAARTLAFGKFRNAGQVCIAPSRFFVHADILTPFTEAFVDYARDLQVGDGLGADTTMGPMTSERRVQAMESLLADAAAKGARILTGGSRIARAGFFFEPTVLGGVPDDCRLMLEEPFGPVAPIIPFDDGDEAIARANALPYGLASYVFSRALDVALDTAYRLESGMVAVNSLSLALAETPFGGVKESGLGHEGGSEGVEGYTTKKYISLS